MDIETSPVRRDRPAEIAGPTIQAIGRVDAISGARLSCRLAEGPEPDAGLLSVVRIGSAVKIETEQSVVFGLVSELSRSLPASPGAEFGVAVAQIDLFGETRPDKDGKTEFSFGISVYPRLDMPVKLASTQELAAIYSRSSATTATIGTLHQDPLLNVQLLIEGFLSKHSAVVGTTGTGKSCALALILRSVLNVHPNGHVVMIDPHGEYAAAFPDIGERISASDLMLPYWLLNYEEIIEILCTKDPASRTREATILRDAILHAKRDALSKSDPHMVFTVDTPVPYQMINVVQHISDAMGKLDRPDSTPLAYLRLLDTIEALGRDERYRFMFGHLAVRDDFAGIVSRIIRVPVRGRPITILDISRIPAEITDVVVSVVCRLVFDFAHWSSRDEAVPVLFVFEEAHRYIPRDASAGFEPTRRSISRIAKEGRKYGVSLCLVTQRPSEISEAVLSQCNTVFAFRLSNQQDQEFVVRTLPEDASGLLRGLTMLGQQEAIAIGDGVAHAMRMRFLDLPRKFQPRSTDVNFAAAWTSDTKGRDFVDTIIKRWRHLSS